MALDKETRQAIASELVYLTSIEVRAFIRNIDPYGRKERAGLGTRETQARHLREVAEYRLNIILDDLKVYRGAEVDISRLVDELDQFIEGVPAEEIYGE